MSKVRSGADPVEREKFVTLECAFFRSIEIDGANGLFVVADDVRCGSAEHTAVVHGRDLDVGGAELGEVGLFFDGDLLNG